MNRLKKAVKWIKFTKNIFDTFMAIIGWDVKFFAKIALWWRDDR